MSDKKPLLTTVLDELNEAFKKLSCLLDEECVNGHDLIDTTNTALVLLRMLRDADHGESRALLVEQMKSMRDDHEGIAWSAAYAHMLWLIDELEE